MITVVVLAGCTGGSSSDARRQEVRSLRDVEMELFMDVGATPAQIAAVRSALRRSRSVRRFEFVSPRDAFRELRRLFADQPELVATTDDNTFPPSFHIDPVAGAKHRRLARSLERLAGVDEVKYAAVVADCEKAKKRLSPELREQLAKLC